MNKEELKEIRTTIAWLFGNGDFKNEEKALEKYKDSINMLKEAINYTHCCTELCDCAIPDPIDPFAEVDKDTCRKCNNLIA